MKVKRIELQAHMIVEFFIKYKKERTIRIIKGLPEDARFLRAYYWPATDTYNLIFESDHFEEVPEGAAIPLLTPEYEAKYGN